MKKLLLLPLLAFMIACNNEGKKEEDVKQKVTELLYSHFRVKKIGLVDTIYIHNIDTLTDKSELLVKVNLYNNYLSSEISIAEIKIKQAELWKQVYKLSGSGKDKYDREAADALKRIEELKIIQEKMNTEAAKINKADSTNFKGYYGRFSLKYTDLSFIQHSLDSLLFVVTPDFKLKDLKEMIDTGKK